MAQQGGRLDSRRRRRGAGAREIASNTAATIACKVFCSGRTGAAPGQLLFEMFNAANLAVFDANQRTPTEGRMATTMTVSIYPPQ
jgi:hypothetical protein